MNYVIINFQSQNTTITVTDYDNTSDNSHDSASGNNTTNSSKPWKHPLQLIIHTILATQK